MRCEFDRPEPESVWDETIECECDCTGECDCPGDCTGACDRDCECDCVCAECRGVDVSDAYWNWEPDDYDYGSDY